MISASHWGLYDEPLPTICMVSPEFWENFMDTVDPWRIALKRARKQLAALECLPQDDTAYQRLNFGPYLP